MGIHDSSKTRVELVFSQLRVEDSTVWLPKLLRLPAFGKGRERCAECDFAIEDNQLFFGDNERRLDPPVALLSWLIRHPQELALSKAASRTPMHTKRRELLDGDTARMIEALGLLRSDPEKKQENWYTFEGKTQPDVFIQTPSILLVIEGKRTEPGPTTKTEWMPVRHQMIRHLDCAWEICGGRQVVGFFIVEGEGRGVEVPTNWRKFAEETTDTRVVAPSLPHRGPEEQCEIASCFAGVCTWQKVCLELGIDSKALRDEVPRRDRPQGIAPV